MGQPREREKESFGMEAKKSNRIEDAFPPGSNSHLEVEKRQQERKERERGVTPEDKDGSDSSEASVDDLFFGWRRQAALTFGMFFPFLARFSLPLARAPPHMLFPPSLSSVRSSITALHLRLGRLHYRKRVTTAVRPASAVGPAVGRRSTPFLLFLSISPCNVAATEHHPTFHLYRMGCV